MNKNPLNSYKETEIKTATQGQLIVMLYDEIIRALNIAADHMEYKYYDIVNTNLLKAQDIISELQLAVNPDAGEMAKNLLSIYTFLHSKLIESNMKKNKKMVEDVLSIVLDLREAWREISNVKSQNDFISGKSTHFSIQT